MSKDNRPVYLIPHEEYHGNYSVEGEGVPPDGVTLSNGCNICAKIEYIFADPEGNPLDDEQILDSDWKDEWIDQILYQYSDEDKSKKNKLLEFANKSYPDNNHPQTVSESNDFFWKLDTVYNNLLVKDELLQHTKKN